MKKLIVAVSVTSIISCAAILANADESQSELSSTYTSSVTSSNQAGEMGTGSESDSASNQASKRAENPINEKRRAGLNGSRAMDSRASKTCTDENGMTFQRGQAGFKDCMDRMHKGAVRDQMGGTAGTYAPDSPFNSGVQENTSQSPYSNSGTGSLGGGNSAGKPDSSLPADTGNAQR